MRRPRFDAKVMIVRLSNRLHLERILFQHVSKGTLTGFFGGYAYNSMQEFQTLQVSGVGRDGG